MPIHTLDHSRRVSSREDSRWDILCNDRASSNRCSFTNRDSSVDDNGTTEPAVTTDDDGSGPFLALGAIPVGGNHEARFRK